MRSASGSPTPKTTCVRPWARRHCVQPAVSAAKASSAARRLRTSGAAATAPAAAAASASAEARLLGGAVSREHGELARNPSRPAVGAGRIGLADPEELLEVALARHAHELVDRHRPGSLGRSPDAPQTAGGYLAASSAGFVQTPPASRERSANVVRPRISIVTSRTSSHTARNEQEIVIGHGSGCRRVAQPVRREIHISTPSGELPLTGDGASPYRSIVSG